VPNRFFVMSSTGRHFILAVHDFKPDVVLNELTDLPHDAAQISELADLNARIRTEGTRNLIEAARRSGSPKILAQSVAWQLPDGPDARAVAELERSVLAEDGVVLRYGQLYGPGTYNKQQQPEESGSHRPSCRTNGGGAGRANGRRRHYRLSARPRSGGPSSCAEFGATAIPENNC
jgi:nucleoside-diphosphate-sugar epimerase